MKLHRSIHWQLLAWQMLLLAAVLTTLLSLHYHLQRKSLITETDATLQSALMQALPALTPPQGRPRQDGMLLQSGRPSQGMPAPGMRSQGMQNVQGMRGQKMPEQGAPHQFPSSTLAQPEQGALEKIDQGDLYLATWDPTGTPLLKQGTLREDIKATDYAFARGEQQFATQAGHRELILPHPTGILIVIGTPLTAVYNQLAITRNHSLLVGSAVFLMGLAGGWLIIRKTLQPIHEISQTAEEISNGDHRRRIELSDAPEELAGLAKTLNNSFSHLHNAIENQKRFSADASHELRTPIAIVMMQSQAALKRDRSTEEYKVVLNACLRAADRMRNMADSLLDLTRIDGNETALIKQVQPVNESVSSAAADAALLSDLHPVDFQESSSSLIADIDPDRIHQVVTNLINNAIQHNPDGCAIHVALKQDQKTARIEINDEGAGISQEALPHIFDRFYRADKSRSREQGGAGLGLSIVKSLVEAHNGTIEAASIPGQSTTFTITLPLNESR